MGQRNLLASATMDQDFQGKLAYCWQFFFWISIAQWSVEEDNTVRSKVAKGKGKKPAAKMEKPRSETTNRQTAFKITICIKACTCINKKKHRFSHYVWPILIWRRLLCSKCGRPAWSYTSINRFHKGFFFSLQNGTISFFFGPVFFSLFFSLLLRTKKSLRNLIYAQMIVFCRWWM